MARTFPVCLGLLVGLTLAFAAPATAAPLIVDGTYVGQDRMAVTDGNKRARKADLVDRTITLDLSHSRISGVANKTALAAGDILSLRAPAKRTRLPLRPARLIVKRPRPPKPDKPAPPAPPPAPEPDPLPEPPEEPQPPIEDPQPPPVEQPQPPVESNQHRGVGASLVWGWIPEQESARDLREAAALGADSVRIQLPWDYLQPAGPGAIPTDKASLVDRLMTVARSENLRVVIVSVGTPCWASSAPRYGSWCDPAVNPRIYPPADPATYGDFVAQLVDRWGGNIAGFEVWNEPNHSGFWNGTAAQYVSLVREADEAVAASSHPGIPIVAGALSGSDTGFLQKLYDNDVDRWADAISIHPYAIRWDLGMVDPLLESPGDIWSFASGVPGVHNVMTANGDSDPIWITEFGYPTCSSGFFCVSQTKQGEYLAAALRRAAEWDYVDTFLMYDVRDWSGGGLDTQFGILNEDWTPKAGTALVKQTLADLR